MVAKHRAGLLRCPQPRAVSDQRHVVSLEPESVPADDGRICTDSELKKSRTCNARASESATLLRGHPDLLRPFGG